MRTIAHVYDSYSEASRVVTALEAAGIAQDDISLVSGDKAAGSSTGTATGATSGDPEQGAATGAGTGATLGTVVGGGAGLLAGLGSLAIPGVGPLVAAGWLVATVTGAGVGAAAGGLAGSLTGAGLSEADAKTHSEGVSRGGTLVTVRTDEAQAERIQHIMLGSARIGTPGDAGMNRTAGTMGTGIGTAGASAPHMSGQDETIKVVREDLTVGKRAVEHGGVRVTSHVVETPVEEQVTLHDEKVRLERRPVTEGGTVPADAFQERVIEVHAMSEEAVISKEARVVEEIALRKTVEDRVETVRDTVRETKVEIEDDGAAKSRASTTTDSPGGPPRR